MTASSGGPSSSTTTSSTLNSANSCAFDPNQRCSRTHSASSSTGIAVAGSASSAPSSSARPIRRLLILGQQEPEEPPRVQGQQVRQLADPREARLADHLDRVAALPLREVELDGLRGAREVVHAEDDVVLIATDVREDPLVRRD